MMEARSFLESVAGFTRDSTADQSANAPVKIGTIDVAYAGTGLPKVKFDGESTTSVKAYPFLNSYKPVATDRVVLMPVGNTYVIVGKIDDTVNNLVSRVAALEADTKGRFLVLNRSQVASAVVASGIVGADTQVGQGTFTAVSGRTYRLRYKCRPLVSLAGVTVDTQIRDGNASTPTTGSTIIANASIHLPVAAGGGSSDLLVEETMRCGAGLEIAAGVHNLLATYQRTAGAAGTTQASNASAQFRELSVLDMGPT
jgi:hypothetical protein